MRWMKSIAKYLLSVVLLAVFGTAAGVVAVCYGDEFYWVALRVARWFGPAGLGLVAGVSGSLALWVAASERRSMAVRRLEDFGARLTQAQMEAALQAPLTPEFFSGMSADDDPDSFDLQAGGSLSQEAAPITVREP